MTATIQPSARMWNTERRDAEQRLGDYMDALQFYLDDIESRMVDRIIFAENSGYDLSPLRKIADRRRDKKRVEFVSFVSEINPDLGKGRCELQMIDKAIEESMRTGFLQPDDLLWKVTGRLRIRNLARLIETAPRRYHFYCDLRSLKSFNWLLRLAGPSVKWACEEFIETRVFSCTPQAYINYCYNTFEHLLPPLILENHMFRLVSPARADDPLIYPRFELQPRVAGVAGFSNESYHSMRYRVKHVARSFLRTTNPWLWV